MMINKEKLENIQYIHIYIYIYMCVCLCLYVCTCMYINQPKIEILA